MRLESARSLKARMLRRGVSSRVVTRSSLPAEARVTASALPTARAPAPVAIGIVGCANRFKLAIRVQEAVPGLRSMLDEIVAEARGEAEVRVIGRVVKQAPWHRERNRPLRIGGSIGHVRITAGTLGCFVTRAKAGVVDDLVLSNNHVLADENRARRGDAILQPAKSDRGRSPRDRVAKLDRFVRLKKSRNLVDAATAELLEEVSYHYNWLEGLGPLRGVRSAPLETGETVYKIGRTTGRTRGRVSAIELDDVRVGGYSDGTLSFDGQIEISAVGAKPFSLGGDSGSLIVDSQRRAVALLFAGNDVDATFASPIETVLDALDVRLVY